MEGVLRRSQTVKHKKLLDDVVVQVGLVCVGSVAAAGRSVVKAARSSQVTRRTAPERVVGSRGKHGACKVQALVTGADDSPVPNCGPGKVSDPFVARKTALRLSRRTLADSHGAGHRSTEVDAPQVHVTRLAA